MSGSDPAAPRSGGADLQPTPRPRSRLAPDHDLDVAVERQQEPQQPLEREVPEMAAQQAGDVRLREPEQFRGLGLGELPPAAVSSIRLTSSALSRCSSASGSPRSANTLPLPRSTPVRSSSVMTALVPAASPDDAARRSRAAP